MTIALLVAGITARGVAVAGEEDTNGFKADVLIRLVDSGKIESGTTQREALEEAFVAASGAQEPIRLDAFRAFLVRHFSARRCGDGFDGPDLHVTQWFNDDLRGLTNMDVLPIDYDEFSGHRVDRVARVGEAKNTPEFNALVREIVLSLRPNRRGSTASASLTPYLKTPETVVGDLLVWHGVGERSMTEFMFKKANLLESALIALPRDDTLHELVLGELVTFVAALGQMTDDRLAWFLHVRTLLYYALASGAIEREQIFAALEDSGNLVLAAYAGLGRVGALGSMKLSNPSRVGGT